MSEHICILPITIYEISGKEIGESKRPKTRTIASTCMAEFCLGKKTNSNISIVHHADSYFQFTEDGDDKYYVFSSNVFDHILSEEIKNIDLVEIMNLICADWHSIFDKLNINKYNDTRIPIVSHLVMKIRWINCGDGEYDVEYELIGYLNCLMELVKL